MEQVKEKTNELLQRDKTPEVIEKIILLNKGLVGKQLVKFGLIKDQDAQSKGYEALYNAILTYDPNKSGSFSTYATVCIYNSLGSYVRSLNTLLRQNTISYDAKVNEDGTSFLDLIASSETADGQYFENEGVKNILINFKECLHSMKEGTQKDIITMWMEADFNITHNEIASALGCSQSYVSQAINKFRKKLKNKLEGY